MQGCYFRADYVDALVWGWLKGYFWDPDDLRNKLEAYKKERDQANNPILALLKANEDLIADNWHKCQFCQNYDISQLGAPLTGAGSHEVEPEEIAAMMLELQAMGCHNINFVSPSHVVAQILAAVALAAQAGLRLPLVYNTGGYDSLTALRLLDGVVDIYMPDMKYADARLALRLSKARNYPEVNRAAVKEMHRQVGDLVMDDCGIAQRGLLVRHLVMPGGLAGTPEVARFVAEEISRDTYTNVMAQYHPCHKAKERPPLDRRITPKEYAQAVAACQAAGLHRFDR